MDYTVLVVDDFEPVQNMYIDVLKRYDLNTLRANNGEDALRLIYSERPDVVLLDVDLPRMSGIEVLKRVRRNPTTKHISIIMVTGNHEVEGSPAVASADLVLIKPVSPVNIVKFVRQFLSTSSNSDNVVEHS